MVAAIVVATLPAFVQWASALYYQPFQYCFLIAGMDAWTSHLRLPRRRLLCLTWTLFLCETLVSYELVLFFGLMVLGLTLLDGISEPDSTSATDSSKRRWRPRLRDTALVATAPLAAVALHFALRLSLFGVSQTLSNLAATVQARAGDGIAPRILALRTLLEQFNLHVWSAGVLLTMLILALASGLAAGKHRARLPSLLGLLLAGGVSFSLMFPATAVFHLWMMYRHLLPFAALLVALVADGGRLWMVRALWPVDGLACPFARRVVAAGLLTTTAAIIVGVLGQNATDILADIRWNRAANVHHDDSNLARSFLDVVYWKEQGSPHWDERLYMALDGRRANVPFNPNTEFSLEPLSRSHYEIWWLDAVEMQSLSILSSDDGAERLASSCRVALFDGAAFRDNDQASAVSLRAFVPSPEEPSPDGRRYEWVDLSLPNTSRARAIRLSCSMGVTGAAIHQIEVR